jgi:hypothetical protein
MADAGMIYALTAKTLAAGADITGTHINSDLIQFVASQVSATADLIEASASTPTPGHVAILLAQKGVGFANLAQNQLVKCGGNLLALGIDGGLLVVEAPTGVGAAVAALEIVADLLFNPRGLQSNIRQGNETRAGGVYRLVHPDRVGHLPAI